MSSGCEVSDYSIGPRGKYELICAFKAAHRLYTAGSRHQNVIFGSAQQRIDALRTNDELWQVWVLRCRGWTSGAAVPVGSHEGILLQMINTGVPHYNIGQRSVLNRLQRLRIKSLVLEEQPVAVAQRGELVGDDGLERRSDLRTGSMVFGKPSRPQINFVHSAVCLS